MKEELTTKMHSEFTVSPETEIKHSVFAVLTLINYSDKEKLAEYAKLYRVTIDDIEMHKDEYFALVGK
ncbi:MAG: hypothetical protein ACOH1N_00440 [Lutibacter sp.]